MMSSAKVTGNTLRMMKKKGEKIAAITSYDYLSTRMIDDTGIDFILVGDSLGMVVMGYQNTLPVTMEDIIHHLRTVARARPRAFVAADMPFMSYQVSIEQAVRNAGRLVKEGGAEGVKLEGGSRNARAIEKIIESSIPVVGHIGLTPQSLHQFGGYKVQGKDKDSARMLVEDAVSLEEAGCCCIVVEGVPWQVAEEITESVKIPTIGIGAGKYCDGQILVIQDMLGINEVPLPRFVKTYDNIGERMKNAIETYVQEVKKGEFPEMDHSYSFNKNSRVRR